MLLQFDIPAVSLATVNSSVQEITVPANVPVMGGRLMTLQHIQLDVEGSNIVVRSDIEVPGLTSFKATITFQPYVANGSILIRNLDITTGSALSLLMKPAIKAFKDAIESKINTLIQNVLADKVTITQLEVSPIIHVTCVTKN